MSLNKKNILSSNNVLVIILGLTILISFIGTFIVITNLSPLTGHATTIYGQVNVTITCDAGIVFTQSQVNFTAAALGESRVTTNPSDITSGPFNLTNEGSSFLNISLSSTPLFSSPQANTLPNKYYAYNITHQLTGAGAYQGNCSCGMPSNNQNCGINSSAGIWRPIPSTQEVAICKLNFTDGADSVLVHINITVPPDEPSGNKNAVITFIASVDNC